MSRHTGLSRRGFLHLGLAGAAAVATLTAMQRMAPIPGRYPALAGEETRRVFTRKEFAVLALFATDIVGAGAGHVTPEQTRVAARIDLELSKHPGKLVSDMRAALTLVEHGPLLRGKLTRYSSLGAKARHDYLASLQHGGSGVMRAAYGGLRFMALFFHYTDPRTWERIGYAGPWVPAKFFEGGNRIANLEAGADGH